MEEDLFATHTQKKNGHLSVGFASGRRVFEP